MSTDVSEEHNPSIWWQPEPLIAACFHAGFFLVLFFDHEHEGDMFLRNVG
jgi:hypothetical protein